MTAAAPYLIAALAMYLVARWLATRERFQVNAAYRLGFADGRNYERRRKEVHSPSDCPAAADAAHPPESA